MGFSDLAYRGTVLWVRSAVMCTRGSLEGIEEAATVCSITAAADVISAFGI